MRGFEPSLLEKLFDDEPERLSRGQFKRHTLEEFKASVATDVESLLNSRFVMDEDTLTEFEQCAKSVMTYGLRDFSSLSLASSMDRAFICQSLGKTIAQHETRLKDVSVALKSSQRSMGGLRFSISAMLIVHPSREPVSFDALLQPSTLQYRVSQTNRML
ncbi:type VI secretion system baseplate subunit TssE [Pseudomonas putida]|uniref:type VI secretion system baseplate subunit TssE n=1 Tax=Pseudomonas putida TaxID=303 RepID=UPI0023643B2B|nr:type VI secretion system baseplate subunit TssE [Pseudomonas putida]MDD1969110.1 type VI secretion system baseplate subunit TssE [Pseudomonas putida]